MTKKDIQRGDLVLLRDGRICVVLGDADDPNKGLTLYGKVEALTVALGKIAHLYDYKDDLTDSDKPLSGYDIMAIRKTADLGLKYSVPFIFDTLFYNEGPNRIFWDWERKDVKEVTMEEVEEKFGCKVKIVKEEN